MPNDQNDQQELILPDQAKKALLEDRKKREEACMAELKAILEKHKCGIETAMLITQAGNLPQVKITAK